MRRIDGDRRRRQDLADAVSEHRARLLPWTTGDGKSCLLSTDSTGGYVSRLADETEAAQLALAEEVLKEAREVLGDSLSTYTNVRYAGIRLADCLTDVLRVAESRGLRLPEPDAGEGGGDAPALSAEAFG
ncbi:hypothetical protein ACPCSP_10325 [Streptomyces cinereoruber]|uniref:hypothetical protein n=1 Tax=Streptomyces cinereoruber TaxID=67260 RepID=UPI00363D2FD2